MRRRLLVYSAFLIGTAIVLVAGYWLLQPTPRIDQATFDKIKIGMTEREVIDIIGAPPGNYGLGAADFTTDGTASTIWLIDSKPNVKTWFGAEVAIHVSFDAAGKVDEMAVRRIWRPYESHFDMVCQWLHLTDRRARPSLVDVL